MSYTTMMPCERDDATDWPVINALVDIQEIPCIRLARGKFELTNQDSAGWKNSSVLTSS